MNINTEQFFNEIKKAVEDDLLELPSLPDVALKIREVAEDNNTTTEEIADILSQDGALSARLLKVVNSPLYRGRNPIDDLHMAVTRMGGQLVRDLITNLAMKNMYQPTSVMMETQFRKAWSASVEIAAICQMVTVSSGYSIKKETAKENPLVLSLVTASKKSNQPNASDAKVDTFNKVVLDSTVSKPNQMTQALSQVFKDAENKKLAKETEKIEAKKAAEKLANEAQKTKNPKKEVGYVTVRSGDTLYKIAKRVYGDSTKFNVIFKANSHILKKATDLSIGQKLKVPKLKKAQ